MAERKKNAASGTGSRAKTGTKKSSSGRAGTSSRSSLNRGTGTGKPSGGSRRKTKSPETGRRTGSGINPAVNTEIFCWSLLVVSVLIFISLLGIGGRVGNTLAGIFFGLMGTNAYVFPFLLFFLTIFVTANRGNRRAHVQAAACAGLFVVVCGLMELMIVGWHESHALSEYYEVGLQYHEGGGLIGGALTLLFCPTIGVAGAYIVLIAAVFLFLALITQKALFVTAGEKGKEALSERRRIGQARREEKQVRREAEREQRRAEELRRREEEQRREEERKRFAQASVLGAENPEDGRQQMHPETIGTVSGGTETENDPDGLSLSFFGGERKRKKTSSAGNGSTNGNVVVFGRLQGAVPDGSEAPDTSFGGREKQDKAVSSETLYQRRRTKENDHSDAQSGKVSDTDPAAAELSPDFVIFRGGESGQSSGSGQKGRIGGVSTEGISRQAGSGTGSESAGDAAEFSGSTADGSSAREGGRTDRSEAGAEETYGREEDLTGGIVTAKQIEEAGASNMRRKAAASSGEAAGSSAGKGGGTEAKADGTSAGKGGSGAGKVSGKKVSAAEAGQAAENVAREIESREEETPVPYTFPPIDLLRRPKRNADSLTDDDLRKTAAKLQQILATFGVNAKVTNVSCGPSVTRYELQPEMGTKVSKITNLADDIKMNLAASDIRIEAPIPGKAAVGIEVPNKTPSMVYLRELIDSDEFRRQKSRLTYVVGKDIAGKIVVSDIAKMPHLLIAGATGSGKSVFINTMIMSIIYNADPSEVKMIMIDPKVVELSVYNGIPHLFIPVVTDPKKAAGALNWAVAEMTKRYQLFAEVGVRNLAGYNAKAETLEKDGVSGAPKKLPQIVIIVDELADLMMVSGNEVEDAICRLAQLARACGIHLVIATQRPSVDVITGLIKANIPSRIAFAVSSGTDSRTILDRNGAERLLGNGDMLFAPQNYKNPVRVQGAYVSDEEVQAVVDAIRVEGNPEKMKERMQEVQKASASSQPSGGDDVDELFAEAGRFIISKDKASIGMLQRWLKVGFNRAARIMDQLSDAGVVSEGEGTKPRKVLMSEEQFENYLEQH